MGGVVFMKKQKKKVFFLKKEAKTFIQLDRRVKSTGQYSRTPN